MTKQELVETLTRKLTDEGRIIEAGWMGFRIMVVPPDAGEHQVRDMRMAFFAGAQHLLASIMTFLDGGDDATEADLRRMDLIHKELNAFVEQLSTEARKHAKT